MLLLWTLNWSKNSGWGVYINNIKNSGSIFNWLDFRLGPGKAVKNEWMNEFILFKSTKSALKWCLNDNMTQKNNE